MEFLRLCSAAHSRNYAQSSIMRSSNLVTDWIGIEPAFRSA
jgi:hypothetical protein